LYKNLDRSFLRFVTMHAFDRRTDGRTDKILIARPRLYFMHAFHSCISEEMYAQLMYTGAQSATKRTTMHS